ncbi:MAG: hypothetical protein EBT19_02510 [Methylocystaceae bacterium]|nr:hypothetical protein [Methylocystaceae bacterium]NBV94274.1 hypothetical protein [Methylocystaceae bacterium]
MVGGLRSYRPLAAVAAVTGNEAWALLIALPIRTRPSSDAGVLKEEPGERNPVRQIAGDVDPGKIAGARNNPASGRLSRRKLSTSAKFPSR